MIRPRLRRPAGGQVADLEFQQLSQLAEEYGIPDRFTVLAQDQQPVRRRGRQPATRADDAPAAEHGNRAAPERQPHRLLQFQACRGQPRHPTQ